MTFKDGSYQEFDVWKQEFIDQYKIEPDMKLFGQNTMRYKDYIDKQKIDFEFFNAKLLKEFHLPVLPQSLPLDEYKALIRQLNV